ncbi:MAG: hypothetical protein JEZ12_16160 [Desulfobacterium sp.]|nr:hypothetical protein [Desulfobacterium sp.]
MTEESAYNWETVDVDETISTADHAVSNDLDIQTPVGIFLVTVSESTPIEKTFKNYNCMAAKLKMRIDDVLKIEQPLLDSKNQPIKREGEIIQKIQAILAEKKAGINALYTGRFIFDEVNLYHVKEKDATKNRRLFVAKKMGIITPQSTSLTTAMWAGAVGRQAIVITEWNSWEDKITKELKKNVKVGWSGYDFADNVSVHAPDTGAGNAENNGQGMGQSSQPPADDFSNI